MRVPLMSLQVALAWARLPRLGCDVHTRAPRACCCGSVAGVCALTPLVVAACLTRQSVRALTMLAAHVHVLCCSCVCVFGSFLSPCALH